jgi:Mg/Co/Ni transporter MgtE
MRGTGADPRFASGPITLMAVDVACTLTYLSIAGVLLKRFLLP